MSSSKSYRRFLKNLTCSNLTTRSTVTLSTRRNGHCIRIGVLSLAEKVSGQKNANENANRFWYSIFKLQYVNVYSQVLNKKWLFGMILDPIQNLFRILYKPEFGDQSGYIVWIMIYSMITQYDLHCIHTHITLHCH